MLHHYAFNSAGDNISRATTKGPDCVARLCVVASVAYKHGCSLRGLGLRRKWNGRRWGAGNGNENARGQMDSISAVEVASINPIEAGCAGFSRGARLMH